MLRKITSACVVAIVAVVSPGLPAIARNHVYDLVSQFGSGAYDEAWGVAVDASGVYAVGYTLGAFQGQHARGGRDAFVRKYDASGKVVWTRQFGTSADDSAYQVAADNSGVYVIGNTAGRLAGSKSAGGTDGFLRKYTVDGRVLWTRQFGTAGEEFTESLAIGPEGILVVGNTTGAFPGATNLGKNDVFLLEFDPAGTLKWTSEFGTNRDDQAFGVATDASGAYVSGYTPGRFAGQSNRGGGADGFVRKVGLDGSELWTNEFGTNGYDLAFGVATFNNQLFVSGATSGVFPGDTGSGKFDGYVRAMSPGDGTVVWTRQFGTKADDLTPSLSVSDAGIVAAGFTKGSFDSQHVGKADAIVLLLDPSGTVLAADQFGTKAVDFADWAVAGNGAIWTVGLTNGRFPGQHRSGGGDAFLARIPLEP